MCSQRADHATICSLFLELMLGHQSVAYRLTPDSGSFPIRLNFLLWILYEPCLPSADCCVVASFLVVALNQDSYALSHMLRFYWGKHDYPRTLSLLPCSKMVLSPVASFVLGLFLESPRVAVIEDEYNSSLKWKWMDARCHRCILLRQEVAWLWFLIWSYNPFNWIQTRDK
jgi:hypothetical protein